MKNTIRKILKLFVPQTVINYYLKRKQLKDWKKNGCPVPPPAIVKQRTVAEYQQKYGCLTLVETGTYLGDMVEAQKKRFKKIISIELAVNLFEKAKKKFKNEKKVIIVQGDSGKILPNILENLDGPAIFWLDGHFSGGITAKGDKECPIFEELDAIFNATRFNHILLIDDARCFNGEGDYPTIEKLTEYVRNKNEKYQVEVKHDIIRYTI